MLSLPVPYPDELLYSVIARAGVHMGITSPKNLLDEIFRNRHIIATIDFPNHLQTVSANYPPSLNLTVLDLIYKHTLFPAYAPFIPEQRRQVCIRLMAGPTKGAIHLAVGAVASRVKQRNYLRYCPQCLKIQFQQFGEYYWMRKWQLAGADCCSEHGPLYESPFERYSQHRHHFIRLLPDGKSKPRANHSTLESLCVAHFIHELLELPPTRSPHPLQWSIFYQLLARQTGCSKGKHILFNDIAELILSRWSVSWLKAHNLYPEGTESCWLKNIFRKHRKAFSYLEHCIVLSSFSSGRLLQNVIEEVNSISLPNAIWQRQVTPQSSNQVVANRNTWESLLIKYGPQQSRKANGALYAWLYRHDREWLLNINDNHRRLPTLRKSRIDWPTRDREVEHRLCSLKRQFLYCLGCPRKSKNWYLSNIQYPSTIAKNLKKLPRTRLFLEVHSESIALYQCRRLITAKRKLLAKGYPISRWRLLRASGLSDLRLKNSASCFLERILLIHGKVSSKKYTK